MLEQTGTLLLRQHLRFQRLLMDMGISADSIDPTFAKTGCGQAPD